MKSNDRSMKNFMSFPGENKLLVFLLSLHGNILGQQLSFQDLIWATL